MLLTIADVNDNAGCKLKRSASFFSTNCQLPRPLIADETQMKCDTNSVTLRGDKQNNNFEPEKHLIIDSKSQL